MEPSYHVIIPARWQSTRLPAKMLADIGGLPMVVRTARQALMSSAASVTIATDDARIYDAARSHGLATIMTSSSHACGTDRLAEALDKLELGDDSLVVNVQGDEPTINPAIIDLVADALDRDRQASIATCASLLEGSDALANPNVVKVVRDLQHRALYFSRSPIPFVRDSTTSPQFLHHIGIYAYRASFLKEFPKLTPGALERLESLEQLRALEHGFKIHVCVTDIISQGGVDTPEDLSRVRDQFQPD